MNRFYPHCSNCADVATVNPDEGQPVYRDAPGHISYKINCFLTLPTVPLYSPGFSRLYIIIITKEEHVKLGQTGPNRSTCSIDIFQVQMGFVTGSNRANPCHHRCKPWRCSSSSGLYRPSTGAYLGSLLRTVNHGGNMDGPGVVLVYPGI